MKLNKNVHKPFLQISFTKWIHVVYTIFNLKLHAVCTVKVLEIDIACNTNQRLNQLTFNALIKNQNRKL